MRQNMLWVPNIPHETTPTGPDESHNIHHTPQGAPIPQFDFEARAHWDIGPQLGIIDFERGTESREPVLPVAGLGFAPATALVRFILDFHVDQHGYTEMYPPFIVRRAEF